MNTFQLYSSWHRVLVQTIPDRCPSRLKNLTWLVVGLYLAMNVQLNAIVRKWPLTAKNASLTRRLERFLDNPAYRVRDWYEPVARQLLAPYADREVTLIIDGSKVGFGHQLLMVALAFRRRALPVAWTWVASSRGHSSALAQAALLAYVRGLLPPSTRVVLVGDAEFGAIPLIRQARRWRWSYVLREKSNHQVRQRGSRIWQPFATLVHKAGESVWWPSAFLTQAWKYPTGLRAYWARHEDEAWLLATNLPDVRQARRAYKRRMWIEELFGDLKGHGLDLESTHLRHFLRLSRLTLAVCLVYVWLMRLGQQTIRAGQRHLVDRHDRRDLSLFRIGRDFADKSFVLSQLVPVRFFTLLSGG